MSNQQLFAAGVIAAAAGYVAKCAFGHWEDYQTHKLRPFNTDDDIGTADIAVWENSNTGTARPLKINKSVFFACPGERGFFCEIIERNENGQFVARAVQYSFAQMREIRKNLTHLPRILDAKEVAEIETSAPGVLDLCPGSPLSVATEGLIDRYFPQEDIKNGTGHDVPL